DADGPRLPGRLAQGTCGAQRRGLDGDVERVQGPPPVVVAVVDMLDRDGTRRDLDDLHRERLRAIGDGEQPAFGEVPQPGRFQRLFRIELVDAVGEWVAEERVRGESVAERGDVPDELTIVVAVVRVPGVRNHDQTVRGAGSSSQRNIRGSEAGSMRWLRCRRGEGT